MLSRTKLSGETVVGVTRSGAPASRRRTFGKPPRPPPCRGALGATAGVSRIAAHVLRAAPQAAGGGQGDLGASSTSSPFPNRSAAWPTQRGGTTVEGAVRARFSRMASNVSRRAVLRWAYAGKHARRALLGGGLSRRGLLQLGWWQGGEAPQRPLVGGLEHHHSLSLLRLLEFSCMSWLAQCLIFSAKPTRVAGAIGPEGRFARAPSPIGDAVRR